MKKSKHVSLSLILCFFLMALFTGLAPTAHASLSAAGAYNVFVFGNFTSNASDSEGSVAVGGNAMLTNYSVASTLSGADAQLIVGGGLNAVSGQVGINGTGNIYSDKPSLGSFTHANLYSAAEGGVNFGAAEASLRSYSGSLKDLTANGTTSFQYGGLTLTGNDAALNVFNVDGSHLSQANSFNINAANGSTVIVNISGGATSFQNAGNSLTGVVPENVIYNFYEAGSLAFSGVSVNGSILAPNATLSFDNGNINGQVVASNIAGGGEFHLNTFTGTVPTPVPGSLLLFGTGLVGLAGIRRRV